MIVNRAAWSRHSSINCPSFAARMEHHYEAFDCAQDHPYTQSENSVRVPVVQSAGESFMTRDRHSHWDSVYTAKKETEVSWFQEAPSVSVELIALSGVSEDQPVIDIGGGTSRLVDHLIGNGFADVTVLDLSAAALNSVKARLGERAKDVTWLVADVVEWKPDRHFAIWHDRAAFHFLIHDAEQRAYIDSMKRGLAVGSHAIIGTFAPDGPERCSGLLVQRYSAETLSDRLGADFELIDSRLYDHSTPAGRVQRFQFSLFRRTT